jgi:hypothetical protein
MNGDIIASGVVATGNSVIITDRSFSWKVAVNTAVSTTVVFNDRFTVTIPAASTEFLEVYGNYQKITVTGAQVNYIVFG